MKKRIKLVKAGSILSVFLCARTAYAAEGGGGLDPEVALQNFTDFLLTIITGIGVLALIWGVVQLALALHNQDPSQRTHAMLYLAGGAVMVGARAVISALGISV